MRIIVCLLTLAILVMLAGCGGENVTPGPNDDWSIVLAMDGLGRNYTQTTQTTVGTTSGASDGLDINDIRAPFYIQPEDKFVTSEHDNRQYIKDCRRPIIEGSTKTWLIRTPAASGKKTLYAWNPMEHDIKSAVVLTLRDQSGNVLWTWDSTKNGSPSQPAYTVLVDPETVLTLAATVNEIE